MKKTTFTFAAVALMSLAGPVAHAATILTFEGLADNQAIGSYYSAQGVTFSDNALALIEGSAGGSGNFSNPPSGVTIAYWLSGGAQIIDVAGGFTNGVGFYFADQVGHVGSVGVYSGLDGTGSLLGTFALNPTPDPYNVWVPVGVNFAGTGQSIVFSGDANYIGFDNVTFGYNPSTPSPAAALPFLLGLLARKRRNR